MDVLKDYLEAIKVSEHQLRMTEIFKWINKAFPNLDATIKWNQPMFTDHGTFIIGFSMAKQHMSFTPEEAAITIFSDDIINSGYLHTKNLAKIKWDDELDYDLLKRIIDFNIIDKAQCSTFFRK